MALSWRESVSIRAASTVDPSLASDMGIGPSTIGSTGSIASGCGPGSGSPHLAIAASIAARRVAKAPVSIAGPTVAPNSLLRKRAADVGYRSLSSCSMTSTSASSVRSGISKCPVSHASRSGSVTSSRTARSDGPNRSTACFKSHCRGIWLTPPWYRANVTGVGCAGRQVEDRRP